MNKVFDVIIIGGGPAGYSSALYCTRAGLSTLVIEKFSPGGQMATTYQVDNYPGFDVGVNGFELAQKMQQGAERFGAISEFSEVVEVNLHEGPKRITTTNGEFLGKSIIIATGASPRTLDIPNEWELRGKGVSYCATCDAMFFKDKIVAVVGGGNSAVSYVLTLSNMCKKVYLIHRRDALTASNVYKIPLQKLSNVEFIWNSEIIEILHDSKLKGLSLMNTITHEKSQLDCNGLFIAIGHTPNTDIFKNQLNLDDYGYIIADETTKTNISGVFAIGDVRTKPLRQIVTATSDGAVASKFAEEYIQSLNI